MNQYRSLQAEGQDTLYYNLMRISLLLICLI